MKDNKDNERSHFSFYDVIVRNKEILKEVESEDGLPNLLEDIRNFGDEDDENEDSFTALDLRRKLPIVFEKTKGVEKVQGKRDRP